MSETRENKTIKASDKMKLMYGTTEQKEETLEKIKENKRQEMELMKDYNKKVYSEQKPIKPIEVCPEWLYKKFKEVSKTILPKDIKGNHPEFIIDKENHHFIKTLVYYFSNDPRFLESKYIKNTACLNKGLLIRGKYGIGKTVVMRIFREIFKGINYTKFPKGFTIESANNMAINFKISGPESYLKHIKHGNWMYDDFGSEELAKHFGNSEEVMQTVLEERYNLFVDKGNKTHLTTNFSIEQINQRYGGRIESRIPQMFNIIVVNSHLDRRK